MQTFNSAANNTVQSEVSAVAISWDETCIISGSSRGIINVWDVLEGKSITRYIVRFTDLHA